MFSTNEMARQSLYLDSEQSNKTAQTWITVSLVTGVVYVIAIFILAAIGVLSNL